MPRLRDRSSEKPQRLSPRGPFPLRTSSSDSDPLHNCPTVDRSPKLGGRRSPRRPQPDSVNQKKFGTRITDLESQLGQAQEELKKLKEQLASAEAAKKEAQQELEKKNTEPVTEPVTVTQNSIEHDHPSQPPPIEVQGANEKSSSVPDESPDENSCETDVFEVPISAVPIEIKIEPTNVPEQEENGTRTVEKKCTEPALSEQEKLSLEMALLNDDIHLVKSKLEEKDKELELLWSENESLNKQMLESTAEVNTAKSKEEDTLVKLSQMEEELKESKANAGQLKQELESMEAAKAELESEMKTMRVQTDQWRKAADAAASVLSGGIGMDGRRVADRCVSMDKHVGNGVFEMGGAYSGFAGSPTMAGYSDDGFESGKRKGTGIRMFGDLWKKRNQK